MRGEQRSSPMPRIRLIHWKAQEVAERVRKLEDAGFDLRADPFDGRALKVLQREQPDAIVIDRSRLPAQGRDVGIALRVQAKTRFVPIVFVAGDPAKRKDIKQLLPDATYASWPRIRTALERALANPPSNPIVPESVFAAYAGTPLAKKLGITPGMTVALVSAPEGFESSLGDLGGVTVRRGARGRPDLVIWFSRERKEVERRIAKLASLAVGKGLWVVWPKKTSGQRSDLTQAIVRKIGLSSGLVDYKVCSVDDTWTGLLFTVRE
jgi:CheY-like chemotaxis protein